MATPCARCGYRPATEADAWDCPQCGTTNRPPVGSRPFVPAPARDGGPAEPVEPASRRRRAPVGRPASTRPPNGVTITATETQFVAVYRWASRIHLAIALVVPGAAAAAYRLLSSPAGVILAAVLLAAAGYVVLMGLVNRTTIRATRSTLESRHGPVPVVARDILDALGFWPDAHDVVIPAARLLRIAKGGRAIMDLASTDVDRTRTKVFLKAVYHDGAGEVDAQLLPSTAPVPVEDWIGLALDGWLTRAGLPVYTGAGRVDA